MEVKKRIETACERAGRDPKDIILIAVSKTHPPEKIVEAVEAGVEHIGENRIQEALKKHEELKDLKVKWHLIGYLQRNKAKYAVKIFDAIHSVDRESLVDELEKRASKLNRVIPVLIEVNVGGEESKHGIPPELEVLKKLVLYTLKAEHLRLIGLMTVAPYVENAEEVRWVFRRLRELRDRINEELGSEVLTELSMGMSNDFEVAIEEGATMVRIGTAIFGERNY